ncbi:polysaccharide biosynthesis/export family protein [Selenomonas ruminantium]|uniref:Polysaccharide export outer membrane protein n=1 Tax=Selenomonas ruminantium TaxID=971 RepID=A0A1H0US52_SELRU|nr:polysaccharide biosynthesis/export family protein [Selenomonas ruminantium]SDP68893.1 polysaccharide export outer membrane protein [Selenomonas ruminantium]
MKKTILCSLLTALALFTVVPAEAAVTGTGANKIEVPSTETVQPVVNGYVEANNIFKTASLHRDQLTSEYRLTKYDVIQLSILGFPNGIGYSTGSTDSNGDVIVVGPDGYATLPYVGGVKLAGLTLEEAGEVIKEKLSQYIKIPSIVVSMKSYGARKVYVMGSVNSPGIKDMNIDNLNAYAAITAAGGFSNRGRSTRVQVIRVIDNTMYYRQLNMKAFIRHHDLTQNVALQDGDIVYVPKSNGIKWKEDILPFFQAYTYYKAIVD